MFSPLSPAVWGSLSCACACLITTNLNITTPKPLLILQIATKKSNIATLSSLWTLQIATNTLLHHSQASLSPKNSLQNHLPSKRLHGTAWLLCLRSEGRNFKAQRLKLNRGPQLFLLTWFLLATIRVFLGTRFYQTWVLFSIPGIFSGKWTKSGKHLGLLTRICQKDRKIQSESKGTRNHLRDPWAGPRSNIK